MTNMEMEDITKTGPIGLKGLNRLTPATDMLAYRAQLALLGLVAALANMSLPEVETPVGLQLSELGYGESKYDLYAHTMGLAQNLQDIRALNLGWFTKLSAGVAKMGVLAGTTFVDGILGTIAGLLNLAGQSASGNVHSASDALWAFIDNPFSKVMQSINENAESSIPNYYTKYELELPWYTQLGTANFWGDKFIKNVGFTIGAAFSAKSIASLASKALLKKEVRDAFKGVVVNSAGKELRTASEIYKAYQTGDAIIDGVKLTEDLGKAAKLIKNAEAKLKVIGAVASAAGEGRIEAITNADLWEQNTTLQLNDLHKLYMQEHPDLYTYNEDGALVPIHLDAINELQNYEEALKDIAKKKAYVGNSIFGLNLALLSGSNLWQFGRFISGGYTAGRVGKNLVTGSKAAGFSVNKGAIRSTYARALSNPLMEAQEEMSQSAISEGSGLWLSSKINNDFGSFYGGKIDSSAEANTLDWLGSVMTGFANSYGDINRWEEGFIGGLTGLLGIPKIKMKQKADGKKGLSVSLDGELWQGLRDARDLKKEAETVRDYLNSRILDPEFLNYYQGMIRHNGYQSTMDGALELGDEFTYKNARHSLMISDAIMFDKAGRIQDLYDMIEEGLNTTVDDVKTIRELTTDKETGKSIYDGMTDELVVDTVKKLAQSMKDTVDKYAEISTNLKTLYGEGIDLDVLEELTWGMTQVNNWENRIGQLGNDLKESLSEKAQILKDRFGIDINITLNNLKDFGANFSEDKNLIDEIASIIDDRNLTVQEGRDRIEQAIKTRQQKITSNNLALGRKVRLLRIAFNKSREKVEKQRLKALNLVDKLLKLQRKLEDLRGAELDDYNAYVETVRESLREELDLLHLLMEAHPSPNAYKEDERLLLEEIQNADIGKIDIYQSFAPIFESIEKKFVEAERLFDRESVVNNRFRGGYDPKSRLVSTITKKDGTELGISEAEEAERRRVKLENSNIFSQIVALKDVLNDPENLLVSPLEVLKLNEKLIDMAKLVAVRSKFLDTYYSLSKNPEMFLDKIYLLIEKAIAAHTEKAVNEGVSILLNVRSLSELRAAISNLDNPSLAPLMLEKLKEGDNEELKLLIKDYEGLEDIRTVIFGSDNTGGIVGTLKGTEAEMAKAVEAINIILDILDTSDSADEAKQSIAKEMRDAEKSNPELFKALESIMDRYDDLSKSRRSSKKDKKSGKTVKNRTEESESSDERPSPRKGRRHKFIEDKEEEEEEEEEIDFSDEEDDEDIEDEEEKATPDKPKSNDVAIVKKLKDLSIEELDKIINDNTDILGEVSSEDLDIISKLALKIKDLKLSPSVHIDSNGTNSEFRVQEDTTSSTPTHRSWVVTGYEINPLKNRKERRAVIYDSPTSNVLRGLGAYQFLDSGRLGRLLIHNPDLPIHYLTAPSVEGLNNHIILAIEVTTDVKAMGGINPIKGSDGKYYQVVGTLGYSSKSATAKLNWDDIKNGLDSERRGITSVDNSPYYVSSKYLNIVSHIYSGRMVKSVEGGEVLNRNLKQLLNGEPPHFGIYYSSTDFRTPTLSGEEVVPLNTNNANPREGSVWLMTREADGRYYAKALHVRRFHNSEWDLEAHRNTPIMERIMEDLRELADSSKSEYERSLAKFDLESVLYFPGNSQFYFTGDIISLKDSEGNTIINNIGEGKSLDDKVEDMILALLSDRLNLRFLVATSELTNSVYVSDLLDSDIITTDLAMVHNVNASFDLPLLDPKTGKPLLNAKEEVTKGHTGKRGINNSLKSTTLVIDRQKYSLRDDGTVLLDGKEVSNLNIIDLVVFADRIAKGKVKPVDGNKNLYIGAYSDGTEFGIINGIVKTGDELKKLKEEAKKASDKAKLKGKQSKVVKKALETINPLENMTQEELADYYAKYGLPEGEIAYDALNARRRLRGMTSQQKVNYSLNPIHKKMGKAFENMMNSITDKLQKSGIPSVTYKAGTWHHFIINNGTGSPKETHKSYITLTEEALGTITEDNIKLILTALQKAGFNGLIKFPTISAKALLDFANIVMHGATRADAEKALLIVSEILGEDAIEYSLFGIDKRGTSHTDVLALLLEERLKNRDPEEDEEYDDDFFDNAVDFSEEDEEEEDEDEEEEESGEVDDSFLDLAASDGVFNLEEEEEDEEEKEDKKEKKLKKPESKKPSTPSGGMSLGETFTPTKTLLGKIELTKLFIANRKLLADSNLTRDKVLSEAKRLGVDLSLITTLEQFEGLITQVICGL